MTSTIILGRGTKPLRAMVAAIINLPVIERV
jgi:hypothetical protein